MKKTLFPVFAGINEPTEGAGRLATWWQALQDHEVCKATIDEYSEAVDKLMQEIRERDSG